MIIKVIDKRENLITITQIRTAELINKESKIRIFDLCDNEAVVKFEKNEDAVQAMNDLFENGKTEVERIIDWQE